jgi:hypothetical protein
MNSINQMIMKPIEKNLRGLVLCMVILLLATACHPYRHIGCPVADSATHTDDTAWMISDAPSMESPTVQITHREPGYRTDP